MMYWILGAVLLLLILSSVTILMASRFDGSPQSSRSTTVRSILNEFDVEYGDYDSDEDEAEEELDIIDYTMIGMLGL